MLRTGNNKNGFTLIEVMVTVAILSLGTLVIHEGLLHSADVLTHYNSLLTAREWSENKIWDLKEALLFSEPPQPTENSGSFESAGRSYAWSADNSLASNADELYLINLDIGWREGQKPINLAQSVYATSQKK